MANIQPISNDETQQALPLPRTDSPTRMDAIPQRAASEPNEGTRLADTDPQSTSPTRSPHLRLVESRGRIKSLRTQRRHAERYFVNRLSRSMGIRYWQVRPVQGSRLGKPEPLCASVGTIPLRVRE
ncbi:hypothetical protein B0F90DRAFT_362121 [Multifurca ochricompacta]|uniref:Uncharacterized protein n=1 Tax=Multifurca ochricompacta TaxID=376703 RepID=A0AAD4M409_9AGAM|nr:hypothetical protein B0F90DRAFT_362121 [Multifurca ochricompacta]